MKLIFFRNKDDIDKNLHKDANRKCSKCGEEKTLDLENFQPVKYFKSGFSYYCNSCNGHKRK